MSRWVTICQDCWAEECPDEYFPDAMEYDDCSQCGQEGVLVAHINPNSLLVTE